MKGFTRDNKFIPMTDYKKVTRKSRDTKLKTQGVRLKRNESRTVYYKSLNKQELEKAIVLKEKIIKGMDEVLKSKFQDKYSEHYREGLRLQKVNKKELALLKKLLNESRDRKKRFISEDDLDRKSPLEINALFKDVEKRWEERGGQTNLEGDGFYMIFRNKESPNYTFEIHPLTDTVEAEPPEHPEDEEFDAWYWFPAKDGKTLWNSPSTMSATGGYTQKDAIREFKKEFISYDQEFSS